MVNAAGVLILVCFISFYNIIIIFNILINIIGFYGIINHYIHNLKNQGRVL